MLDSIIEKFLAFVAIIVEIFLGSILGYIILRVAHDLEVYVALMKDAAGTPLYYGAIAVEWVLLIVDVLIVVLFAADGLRRAYTSTFGKHERK